MARQLNKSGIFVQRTITPLMLCMALLFTGVSVSQAAQPGHGRVNSVAGSPLQVSIPISGLSADDLKVLKASVAETAAWEQAGLSLPASIESLSVTVEPGVNSTSRNLILRSTQVVNRPVIDVLIRLTTASGTTSIQSSYLVLVSETSSQNAGSVRVARGDTLYGIALTKSVSGADIYQVMWAIYEANPQAFIADNMNLLRAGVTLNIPDATTMRAVDPKHARTMFAKHDQAFRTRRGAGQVGAAVPTVASKATQTGSVTNPPSTTGVAPSGDQVRLASTNPADQQADSRVANVNEMREMQAQVEALQKNVKELKDALQKNQSSSGGVGATGAAGATGATGQSGATGAPGSPGAPGTMNAASHSSAAGASKSNPTQDTSATAAGEVKTGLAKFKHYASDHVLGIVLGVSALLALIIAFLLKRAGRNTNTDEAEQIHDNQSALTSNFDQKLQSIDLNLSNDDKPSPPSGNTKSGV